MLQPKAASGAARDAVGNTLRRPTGRRPGSDMSRLVLRELPSTNRREEGDCLGGSTLVPREHAASGPSTFDITINARSSDAARQKPLRRVREQLREYLVENRLSHRVISDIQLSVVEACTNALVHSDSRSRVRVTVEIQDDELIAVVSDDGVACMRLTSVTLSPLARTPTVVAVSSSSQV